MSFFRRIFTKNVLAFLSGPAAWLGARAIAFPALAKLFAAWNLNEVTYVYVPAWARFVADRSGEIIDIFALTAAVAAFLAFLRPQRPQIRPLVSAFCAGAAAAVVPMGILLLAGCVRLPAARDFSAPAMCVFLVREALYCLFAALWIRQIVVSALQRHPGIAIALCGVLQAALLVFDAGIANATIFVNGVLIGAAFAIWYRKTRSPFPEAAFSFAFLAVSRVAFGFPDLGGAYVVSEEWLSGFGVGSLEGAGLMTILLAAGYLAAIFLPKIRRE